MIKKMQGVAAHIEYIKKNYESVDFINCKFWKNEICYNTISTKYGERCYSKRGCMYSVPLPVGSKAKVKNKNDFNIKKDKVNAPTITYTYKISDIKRNYFNNDIDTIIRVNNKLYKVKCKYNSSDDELLFKIGYKFNDKVDELNFSLFLNKVIRVSGNEVIFTVKIDDICNYMRNINKNRVADLIKKENTSDIVRKAIVSDSKDVTAKIESLIKFTSYVIIKAVMCI